ncbi:MAG: hypothetical protein OXI35_11895 [Gemmatimonadota bacterium]|nr:hypothetical protein [Gemmatimonadota bacterium]
MKTKALILCSALPLTALMASGCYTVLSSPYEAADLHDEDLARAKSRDVEAPTVGQFDDRDYMDDLYRYPGVRGGYGGYGGYYGGYGGYGGYYPTSGYYPYYYGGYPSYYGGYGPYSYGYDPYYRSSSGYYVPPGYELVSTRQLDDLRAASRLNATPAIADPAAATERQRREENVWQRRVEPRVRSAPTPTPRSTVSRPPSGSGAATKAPAATSAPASKSSATKESAKPKKRRR